MLNYRIEGNGKPLLLVHGFGISFNIWQNLLPFLRPHFTLVMVELPGVGQSPMTPGGENYLRVSVDAIERLRLALGFDSWDVLGYSTGSRIAEAYAQKDWQHVRRAIFLCPMALGISRALSLRVGLWVDHFIPAIGNWILRGWRLKFLILLFGFNLQPDPHTDEWSREIGALPVGVLKQTLKMVAAADGKMFSAPAPFSIIWGDADIIAVAPRRRGPRDHVVRANHAAPVAAAQEVAQTMLSILNQ